MRGLVTGILVCQSQYQSEPMYTTASEHRTRMSSDCQLPVSLLDLEVRGRGWYTQGIVVAGIRDHVG